MFSYHIKTSNQANLIFIIIMSEGVGRIVGLDNSDAFIGAYLS